MARKRTIEKRIVKPLPPITPRELELRHKADTLEELLEKNPSDFSPKDQEALEKLSAGAENVIRSFDLKPGEQFLIITDSKADELMVKAILEKGRTLAGDNCRLVIIPETTHAAQDFGSYMSEKMQTADAILIVTSLSRSHSDGTRGVAYGHQQTIEKIMAQADPETFADLRNLEPADISRKVQGRRLAFPSKARVASITNTNRDTFTIGGATENIPEMKEREERFAELMKDVTRVRITNPDGTNLELNLKAGTYFIECGSSQRGDLSNWPTGEYAGSVDLAGTSGTYVCDGAVGMIGKVDAPITLHIKDGKVIKVEGGQSADRLRQILDEANANYRAAHPEDQATDAYRLAEFAFGMNSKAFRYGPSGERLSPPTSLEGEKGLGTMHIAVGQNKLFGLEKNDPDLNDIPIHIDLVAMNTDITGLKADGSEIELIKNGQMIAV